MTVSNQWNILVFLAQNVPIVIKYGVPTSKMKQKWFNTSNYLINQLTLAYLEE